MSTIAAETDTFPATVITPDVNDVDYYVSVPQGLTELASRTRHTANTLGGLEQETLTDADVVGSDTAGVLVPPFARAYMLYTTAAMLLARIVGLKSRVGLTEEATFGRTAAVATMNVPIAPIYGADGVSGATGFGPAIGSNILHWEQLVTTGPPALVWALPTLPVTGTITGFEVYVRGQPSSHAGLPATMPTVGLYRQVANTAAVVGAAVTDASANVAAYETLHTIASASLTEPISHTNNYYFKLTGEGGANAVGFGLFIYVSRIYVTRA